MIKIGSLRSLSVSYLYPSLFAGAPVSRFHELERPKAIFGITHRLPISAYRAQKVVPLPFPRVIWSRKLENLLLGAAMIGTSFAPKHALRTIVTVTSA